MDATTATTIITSLVDKLGPVGNHLFQVYITQKFSEGVAWLSVGILALLVILIVNIAVFWYTGRPHDETSYYSKANYDHDAREMRVLSVGISCVFIVVVGLAIVIPTLMVLNPEYYAIQSLLGR